MGNLFSPPARIIVLIQTDGAPSHLNLFQNIPFHLLSIRRVGKRNYREQTRRTTAEPRIRVFLFLLTIKVTQHKLFLQVRMGSPRSGGLLPVWMGSYRSGWVPPGLVGSYRSGWVPPGPVGSRLCSLQSAAAGHLTWVLRDPLLTPMMGNFSVHLVHLLQYFHTFHRTCHTLLLRNPDALRITTWV